MILMPLASIVDENINPVLVVNQLLGALPDRTEARQVQRVDDWTVASFGPSNRQVSILTNRQLAQLKSCFSATSAVGQIAYAYFCVPVFCLTLPQKDRQ